MGSDESGSANFHQGLSPAAFDQDPIGVFITYPPEVTPKVAVQTLVGVPSQNLPLVCSDFKHFLSMG